MESKDVFDITVCDNSLSKLFFIEVKYFTGKKGRIGFGDRKGRGYQPEILKNDEYKFFEDHLLWVFQKENDTYYYILKNADCRKHIAGDAIGEKQNNFKLDLFKEEYKKTEEAFAQYLKEWLNS